MAKKTLKKEKVKKLTKLQEKRVAIAKDAIAQLNTEAYVAATGQYVGLDWQQTDEIEAAAGACKLFTGKDASDFEFNKVLDNVVSKQNPCEVCAKGALFLSSIRKFNNFTLEEASDGDLDNMASHKVQEIFGEKNADLIEIFYEKWDADQDMNPLDEETFEKVEKWANKYPNNTDRLIAILKNIVKNNGEFIP